jgi:hypothetical protein
MEETALLGTNPHGMVIFGGMRHLETKDFHGWMFPNVEYY